MVCCVEEAQDADDLFCYVWRGSRSGVPVLLETCLSLCLCFLALYIRTVFTLRQADAKFRVIHELTDRCQRSCVERREGREWG